MGGADPNATDPTQATDWDSSSDRSTSGERDKGELEAGTMVGEYRVDGKLGSGGMGKVYSATHPVIGKRVAIKVLHPSLSVEKEAVDRFIQEARAVNQIGHPNIIDIFSFGSLPDGRCYFVMEQLRGESLATRIERGRPSIVDVVTILDTIAVALEAAHRKGIVHRDLKPDNVFLVEIEGGQPLVKLLDFGIAKLTSADAGVSRTRTGNVMGTPAYISPEQARGQGVDHRTDIYAFGAVAYELLTGQLVYPATNAADMIAQHLHAPPPSARALNAAVDVELDNLIVRMLAKNADDRPTFDRIREELAACKRRILQARALHEGGHTDPVVDISDPRLRNDSHLRMSMPIDPPGVTTSETVWRKQATRARWLLIAGIVVAILVPIGVLVAFLAGGDDKPQKPKVVEPAVTAPAPTPTPPVPPTPPTAPSAATEPAATEPVADPPATEPVTEPVTKTEPAKPSTAKPTKPKPTKPVRPPPPKPNTGDDRDAPM